MVTLRPRHPSLSPHLAKRSARSWRSKHSYLVLKPSHTLAYCCTQQIALRMQCCSPSPFEVACAATTSQSRWPQGGVLRANSSQEIEKSRSISPSTTWYGAFLLCLCTWLSISFIHSCILCTRLFLSQQKPINKMANSTEHYWWNCTYIFFKAVFQ